MAQSIWDLLSPQSAVNSPAANFAGFTNDGRPLATSNMGTSYGNYLSSMPDGSWSVVTGKAGKLPYWSASLGPAPPEYQFQPDMVQPGVKIQTQAEADQFKQQHGGVTAQQYNPNFTPQQMQELSQRNAQIAQGPTDYQRQFSQSLQQAASQMFPQMQTPSNQWASTLPAQEQSPWGFQTQPAGYQWSQMPGMSYQNYGGGQQQFSLGQPQTMQWGSPFQQMYGQRPAMGGAGMQGLGSSYQARTYGGPYSRPSGENRALPANTPNAQPNNLWSRPATLNRGAQQGRGLFYNY